MDGEWVSPREARLAELREALNEAVGGSQIWELEDDVLIEVIVRLPEALPTDESLHGFPLPTPWADSVHPSVSALDPFVSVSTITIPAPWRHPENPEDLMRGLQAVVGADALPTPGEHADTTDEPPLPPEAVETWMSVRSIPAPLRGEEDSGPLFAILDRGLIGLNRIIRALPVVRPHFPVKQISREHLDLVGFWRIERRDGTKGAVSVFPISAPIESHFATTPLTEPEAAKLNQAIDLQGEWHPFVTHRDWFNLAEYERVHTGDTAAAVIALQTAAETLLTNVVYMLRVDEGETSDALSPERADPPAFKTLVTREFHPRLQGSWTVSSGAVGQYWSDLYELRNSIVHAGVRPSYEDMEGAFKAYNALADHLGARMRANSRKYPRTLFALYGTDGLERRGWMTARLRQTADTLLKEPNPFWLPRDLAGR
jgi:hypothetical protein